MESGRNLKEAINRMKIFQPRPSQDLQRTSSKSSLDLKEKITQHTRKLINERKTENQKEILTED
jgi:hypothetical protein